MANVKFEKPILYIFSGLPGTGKSTISQIVAQQFNAVYLRIDTIEQALRDLCGVDVQGEGYRLAYKIAFDNLRLGMSVVADSCNPIELTRREWEQVALDAQTNFVNIEVICSNIIEHRQRVEARIPTIPGRKPIWSEIEKREYHQWTVDRIIIDTASRLKTDCVDELLFEISCLQANHYTHTHKGH